MLEEQKEKYLKQIDATLVTLSVHSIESFQEASVSAISIVESIYGTKSFKLREMLETIKEIRKLRPEPGAKDVSIRPIIHGYLANVRDEINSGLIEGIYKQVVAETVFDFVSLAETALDNQNKDVAAVLASAALEDIMKKKAEELGIDTDDKDLSEVVHAMKAAAFFAGPQHKLVSSFVTLRNKAMHAEWAKIHEPEVSSVIAFIKTFITQGY